MGSHHEHQHNEVSSGRLFGAATANVSFAVVQIVVGLAIGSIAVLADAAHQVVDAIGLVTGLGSVLLLQRPATTTMSFGWGKADALGGFMSGLLLLASVVWIGYESITRLFDPPDVNGTSVIVIGLIAMGVNAGSLLLLGHGSSHLSLQAARLHLVTDLAGSAIVVVAGAILAGTTWTWVDPAASILLSVAVLGSTIRLLRKTAAELLDRTPSGLTTTSVEAVLQKHPAVTEAHHIHLRPLGGGRASVTAHVIVAGPNNLHEAQLVLDELTEQLETQLHVEHATLQFECHTCEHATH